MVEILVALEPVLAPAASLLKQKIPVLVGASNFFVPMCNFSFHVLLSYVVPDSYVDQRIHSWYENDFPTVLF